MAWLIPWVSERTYHSDNWFSSHVPLNNGETIILICSVTKYMEILMKFVMARSESQENKQNNLNLECF